MASEAVQGHLQKALEGLQEELDTLDARRVDLTGAIEGIRRLMNGHVPPAVQRGVGGGRRKRASAAGSGKTTVAPDPAALSVEASEVLAHLRSASERGMRAGQIVAATGFTADDARAAVLELVRAHRVDQRGVKSATRYYAVDL